MKQVIAGYGFVGKEVNKLIKDADIYDPLQGYIVKGKYDFCHICAPTPAKDSGECDRSAVEDILQKVEADIYICRSTIPPGTTDKLEDRYLKNIIMQPEYCASSSPYPAPLSDLYRHPFIILGGRPLNTKKVRKMYESYYPPTCRIHEVSALEAEIIKYAENSYIATKVTFANELFEICRAYSVDYDKVREGVFICDPRMTPWWTYVREGLRGWGGHCLGKDTSAIVYACKQKGYDAQLIRSVIEINQRHRA